MAEVGHKVFESNTIFSTTQVTPQVAYTIATAGELTAAGDYIIICDAGLGGTSGATSNERRMALYDNDVVIATTSGTNDRDTLSRIEPANADATSGDPYGVVIRHTKAASGDITLKIWNPDAGTTTSYWCNTTLILLDDLVEDEDFFYDLHIPSPWPDSDASPYTDGASITLPAGASEKYLAFAHCRFECDNATQDQHQLKIVDDTTSRAEISRDNKDVQDVFEQMTVFPVLGAAGTKTVKLQYNSTGNQGDLERSIIFVLRVTSTWKKGDLVSGGTATVTAADTFVEVDTLALTANHTGDHCIMGGGIFNAAHTANRRERQLTSEIGAAGEVVQAGSSIRQIGTDQTADEVPFLLMGESSFTDADSLTFDVDAGDSVNNTNESLTQGFVAAWTWEKEGSGVIQNIVLTENVIITDADPNTILKSRIPGDRVELLTDAVFLHVAMTRLVQDNFSAEDSFVIMQSLDRQLLDIIEPVDIVNALKLVFRQMSEQLTVTDAIVQISSRGRILVDGMDVTDSVVQVDARGRIIGDALSVTDSFQKTITRGAVAETFVVVLEEIVAIDDLVPVKSGQIIRGITDTIAVDEFIALEALRQRVLSGTIDITDFMSPQRTRNQIDSSDTITATDSIVKSKRRNVQTNESFNITDVDVQIVTKPRVLTDSFIVNDDRIVSRSAILNSSVLTDTLNVTDLIGFIESGSVFGPEVCIVHGIQTQ